MGSNIKNSKAVDAEEVVRDEFALDALHDGFLDCLICTARTQFSPELSRLTVQLIAPQWEIMHERVNFRNAIGGSVYWSLVFERVRSYTISYSEATKLKQFELGYAEWRADPAVVSLQSHYIFQLSIRMDNLNAQLFNLGEAAA